MALTNRKLIMIGTGISLLMVLIKQGMAWSKRHHSGNALDEALAETFPASDPVATQDYAIPANRVPASDLSAR